MYDLLLINPPISFYKERRRPSLSIPLGLVYLYSAIKDKLNVKWMDFVGHQNNIIDDFSKNELTQEDFTVGCSWKTIEEELKKNLFAKYVGISCTFYENNIENCKKLAALIKKLSPETKIILGGAGICPEGFENTENIDGFDIILFGEGEEVLCNIIKDGPDKNNRGIIFKTDDGIFKDINLNFVKDLKATDMPDFKQVNFDKYFEINRKGACSRYMFDDRSVNIITSRGCPNRCYFCGFSYGK